MIDLKKFLFPFLSWSHKVNSQTLRADAFAGATNAAVVLPQGVAFAMIAGMPPEYGLYTAIVPAIVAALYGSSFHLISGPTTAISLVVFGAIAPLAEPGTMEYIRLALTLTFLAGLIQFALGAGRLGSLINFVSHSVVVGFTAGAAILIASGQLKHFFGLNVKSAKEFIDIIGAVIMHIADANPYTTAVAVTTLAVTLLLRLIAPNFPGMLVAMVMGGLMAFAFGAEEKGIVLVGELPASLPPVSLPDFSPTAISSLTSASFAVAMLGLIEAVSIARSIASKSHQQIDGNQEFIGQGMSNIVGSFLSSYASSGSFSRSGINFAAGAVTPVSAIFAAVFLALIVLFAAPLAKHLPIAAMAGIIVFVAYRLIDFHHIRGIIKSGPSESAVMIATFLATLFVQLEFAIYVGMIMSLVLYLNRTSKPRIVSLVPDPKSPSRHLIADPDLHECPQMKIIRIDGSIFFGSINHVQTVLQGIKTTEPDQRHVLVVCSGVNFIDVAGAEMITTESKRIAAGGGGLYFYGVKPNIMAYLRQSGHLQQIGEDKFFLCKGDAIEGIFDRLDHPYCGTKCHESVFLECRTVKKKYPPVPAPAT